MCETTAFEPEDLVGWTEALQLCETVDLVQVREDAGWRGVRIDEAMQS